jgi:hypothetical protein
MIILKGSELGPVPTVKFVVTLESYPWSKSTGM